MLLGLTEFTKLYIQIKDNNDTWAFVNLVRLVQNSGIGDTEVVELLKIAHGYLPRVRLEYDRVKAELDSWKAELNNIALTYQQFVDRNLALKNREDELQSSVNDLEIKETELQKTTTELQQHLAELQENNTYRDYLNPEVKEQNIISTDDITNHNDRQFNHSTHFFPLIIPFRLHHLEILQLWRHL